MKQIIKLNNKFAVATLIIFSVSCSKTSFSPVAQPSNSTLATDPPPPPSPSTGGQTCGINQVSIHRPTKVMFVVDQSGSNQYGPDENPGTGTDADKKFRMGVMQKFYSDNLDKVNVSWGLTVFNNSSAKNLVVNSKGSSVAFSNNPKDFKNALDVFVQRIDDGDTPYKSALKLVQKTIAQDFLTAPEHVIYLVVFLTDGYPTDYCSTDPNVAVCNGPVKDNLIFQDILSLTSIAPKAVQFSTAYYGLPDSVASNRLAQMAKVGEGQFVDTNISSGVQLNDLIQVDQEICVNQ